MKKNLLIFLAVFSLIPAVAQERVLFENPVISGDIADPSVILVDDTYYATGTSSEWAPFYPLFTSSDLINWKQTGHIFDEKPSWASHSFWAPELFYHHGTMYCYYTARRKSDNTSYIGVATAEGTSLQFTDHGPIVEHGTEAIDAFVYDDDGQLYLTWKAYGLDHRPIELLGSRLSDDGLRLEGEPFSLLKDDEGIGLEGQYHYKQRDYYYIIYSAKSCCGPSSDYDVRVARSGNFRGPYEKYEGNPILSGGGGDYLSCGHGTAVPTPDGRMFYLSHGYQTGDAFYLGRQPILHEFFVNDSNWIEFKTGKQAVISQTLPFANTIQKKVADFDDDFSGGRLKVDWTWNYPYSAINARQERGKLLLTGTPKTEHKQGTVLCLRPQTIHYSYETKVENRNDSFKGLTMYGDDNNLVALGIKGREIILKSIKEGTEDILYLSNADRKNIRFRIDVEKGCDLSFSYSSDGKAWTRVNNTPLDASFLVRWDRVARPGLIHTGAYCEPAIFDYFQLTNH
jgi:beta-xylosidase